MRRACLCSFVFLPIFFATAFNEQATKQLQSQLRQGTLRVTDLNQRVAEGADVNAVFTHDNKEITPLCYLLLVSKGGLNHDLFNALLRQGADATLAAKSLILLLEFAAVKFLIDAGADMRELLNFSRHLCRQMEQRDIRPFKVLEIIAYLEQHLPKLPNMAASTTQTELPSIGISDVVRMDDADTSKRRRSSLTLARCFLLAGGVVQSY